MLTNCPRCGQLFDKTMHAVCAGCLEEEDSVFHSVREYLKEHRNATVPEVVDTLEVEVELVVTLLEEGRLELIDAPNFTLVCAGCGIPTNQGRYCQKCQDELALKLAKATVNLQKKRQKSVTPAGHGFYSR